MKDIEQKYSKSALVKKAVDVLIGEGWGWGRIRKWLETKGISISYSQLVRTKKMKSGLETAAAYYLESEAKKAAADRRSDLTPFGNLTKVAEKMAFKGCTARQVWEFLRESWPSEENKPGYEKVIKWIKSLKTSSGPQRVGENNDAFTKRKKFLLNYDDSYECITGEEYLRRKYGKGK